MQRRLVAVGSGPCDAAHRPAPQGGYTGGPGGQRRQGRGEGGGEGGARQHLLRHRGPGVEGVGVAGREVGEEGRTVETTMSPATDDHWTLVFQARDLLK